MRTKVLITGFEPFTTGQGVRLTENPTGALASDIAQGLNGAVSATLPVSFRKTKTELRRLFEVHRPKIWLGLGFAPHRSLIDVEYVALNIEHAVRGDNDGKTPTLESVYHDGPKALFTRFPIEGFVQAMKAAGLSAQVGLHAGTFLCNQTFYLGCYEVDVRRKMDLAGFIHVPPGTDSDTFVSVVTQCLKDRFKETGCD